MDKKINVEAEGGELILANNHGDHVIIPKDKRSEVNEHIKQGCNSCIDSIVDSLPIMDDYADNGTVIKGYFNKGRRKAGNLLDKTYNYARKVKREAMSAADNLYDQGKAVKRKVISETDDLYDQGKEYYNDVVNQVSTNVDNAKEQAGSLLQPYPKPEVTNIDIPNGIFDFSIVSDVVPTAYTKTSSISRNNYIYEGTDHRKCKPGDKECTAAITNYARNNEDYDFIKNANFRGDGWNMQTNMEEKGAHSITNVFSDLPIEEKKNMTPQQVIEYVNQKTSDSEYKQKLYNSIEPGDYVSLLYPSSDNFNRAKKDSGGKFLTTHGGDTIEEDGILYVRDNVDGEYHYRPLKDVIEGNDPDGVRISGAVKSEIGEESEYYEDPNMTLKDGVNKDNLLSKAALRASLAQNRNKDMLMKRNGWTEEEWKEMKILSKSIMWNESKFGSLDNNERYQSSIGNTPIGIIEEGLKDIGEWVGLGEESRTLGNIKFSNYYSDQELEDLGIKKLIDSDDHTLLETPELSGILVMEVLARNRKKFNKLLEGIPKKDLEQHKEVFKKLEYQSWNQGLDKIKINIERYKKSKDIEEFSAYFQDEDGNVDTKSYNYEIDMFNNYQEIN